MLSNKDSSNTVHTILLICAMAILAGFVGFLLGGKMGLIGAVLLSLFGLVAGTRASASLVLRMYKAQPMQPQQAPQLFDIYNELCRRAGLSPYPKLYYIPTRMPNAFAVGVGNSSAVALTDGLLRMMNPRELAGILAHELTHVRCRDTTVLGMADIFSRTISALSRVGLFMIFLSFGSIAMKSGISFWTTGAMLFFSPTIAVMLQLALSRTREFNADRGAAELTGDAHGLASALKKLDRIAEGGMLQRILRPGMRRRQPSMLRTHPPTEDRIAALAKLTQDIAMQKTLPEGLLPEERHIPLADQPRVRKKPRYHLMSGLWG